MATKVIRKSWHSKYAAKEKVKTSLHPGDKVVLFPRVHGCVAGLLVDAPVQAVFVGVDRDGMPYFEKGRKVIPKVSEEDAIAYLHMLEADVVRLTAAHYNDEDAFDLADYAVA